MALSLKSPAISKFPMIRTSFKKGELTHQSDSLKIKIWIPTQKEPAPKITEEMEKKGGKMDSRHLPKQVSARKIIQL